MGITLAVVIIVAIVASIIAVRVLATQQAHIQTPLSPNEARMIIDAYFRTSVWNRVPGPGDINVKPKLRTNAPTMSLDIEPAGTGSQVSAWTSAYTTQYGIAMYHGGLMIRKRRGLSKRLLRVAPALPAS